MSPLYFVADILQKFGFEHIWLPTQKLRNLPSDGADRMKGKTNQSSTLWDYYIYIHVIVRSQMVNPCKTPSTDIGKPDQEYIVNLNLKSLSKLMLS